MTSVRQCFHALLSLIVAMTITPCFAKGDFERFTERTQNHFIKPVAKAHAQLAETVLHISLDLAVDKPLRGLAKTSDNLLHTHYYDRYARQRRATIDDFETAGRKIGVVLEASTKPENLGKIALIYMATAVAGPFGAALVNVLYDKMVLGQDMSNEDMLKSFAIGMAAGYAAEGVSGTEYLDIHQHASYAAKIASNLARNLTTDVGNSALKEESFKDTTLLKSVLGSVAVIETGDGVGNQVLESTVDGALGSSTEQIVDHGDIKKVNWELVEKATYQGFADGLTREAVEGLLDQTVIPHLPQRVDKVAFKKFKETYKPPGNNTSWQNIQIAD